jgi:aminoglycoside 6-adenylyltransferase
MLYSRLMTLPTYQQLEERVVAWLRTQADIRAALIVGSRARIDPPADHWSDVDFILFVNDIVVYTADSHWLNQFGVVEIATLDHNDRRGDAEWIAVFDDGRKIDVLFAPAQPVIDVSSYAVVIQYGARVVFDRDGDLQALVDRVRMLEFVPPTPEDFSQTLQQAWLTALRAAKFARRGDLWRAKHSCDGALKQAMLRLLEWQAHIGHDHINTWHDGRYLAEWADQVVVDALPATFAAYDRSSIQAALLATIELLHRLAQEIAAHWQFAYPVETAARVVQWIKDMQA